MITLYHNPRCSKSRQALSLLEEENIDLNVIRYLDNPLNISDIKDIVKKLGQPISEIIRTNEKAYKELNLQRSDITDQELIEAIIQEPRLLQRPIAIKGKQAVIGRPPEKVLTLI